MPAVARLSRTMTIEQFRNGYWYATELKAFADELGIPRAGQLRKNELEPAILNVLATGKVARVARGRPKLEGTRDVERGLALDLRVVVYTNDKETKDFLEREAAKLSSSYKRRSGARYRINRWREDKLAAGEPITYRDLIAEYVRLSVDDKPFAKVPTGRYINFLAEYLAKEPKATHAGARAAWKQLKKLDVPKDYASWKARARRKR
jgi:SAP domain-containing protein